MPTLIHPTLPLDIESYASHVLFSTSLEPSGQGGTNLASDQPPQILFHFIGTA